MRKGHKDCSDSSSFVDEYKLAANLAINSKVFSTRKCRCGIVSGILKQDMKESQKSDVLF